MNDLYVMQATLASASYMSFVDSGTFKDIAAWADDHTADVSVQRSDYAKGNKVYIVRISDALMSEAEWNEAFERGYVEIANTKFYVTEGRCARVGTSML